MFNFFIPTRFLFGSGKLNECAEIYEKSYR